MQNERVKWSWFTKDKWKELARSVSGGKPGEKAQPEEDNPWLELRTINLLEKTDPVSVESAGPYAGSRRAVDVSQAPAPPDSVPSRWLGDNYSPYGFADEDGTMKQVETQAWRRAFKAKPAQRFVPAATAKSATAVRGSTHLPSGSKSGRYFGSVLLWQSAIAAVLIVGSLYVHQSNNANYQSIQKFLASSMQTDYTGRVVPAVSRFFAQFHIQIPTFNAHASVRLHAPLNGRITVDYSTEHPEMSIQGVANELVFAAGSGTVTKIDSNPTQTLVEIDHGTIGSSIYLGLGHLTVRLHEYVDAGQVIGRLPASPKDSTLRFAMIHGGKFVNPHTYIQFTGTGV